MRYVCVALAGLLASTASGRNDADQTVLREGLEGSLRGCEAWVLEPASWATELEPFLAEIGLPGRVLEASSLPESLLPPLSLRRANRYWRIDAGSENGYTLVVSEGIPMCHISGGGIEDLQPVAEKVIAAADFAARWEVVSEQRSSEIVSTLFRSRQDKEFTLLISRAARPHARRDRPQIVATGFYSIKP